MSRVAVIQRPPVFLNKSETIGLAVNSVREAAVAGVRLVVFPEAFIPGYPAWIWRLRPGADMNLSERLHARLLAEAVRIDAGTWQLCAMPRVRTTLPSCVASTSGIPN